VVHQDILTCGVCQKPFALADIVKFIQHKVLACNKENYSLGFSGGDHRDANNTDSDDGDGGGGGGGSGSASLPVPLGVVNTRRPSISAPINSKKAVAAASSSSSATASTPGRILCTPPPSSPRMLGPADILMDEPPSSTPKRRAGSSSPPGKADDLNHNLQDEDLKPRIKQEHLDTGSSPDDSVVKRIRTDVVDAESNTTHSGKLCITISIVVRRDANLLTPWSRILLEKPIVNQLVKKSAPPLYGTKIFVTVLTKPDNWTRS